jgi:hypothetical protein
MLDASMQFHQQMNRVIVADSPHPWSGDCHQTTIQNQRIVRNDNARHAHTRSRHIRRDRRLLEAARPGRMP